MSTMGHDILHRHHLSVEDYHRMGETGIIGSGTRVELIKGEIIDMTPIGTSHAAAVNRLTRLLDRTVRDAAIISVQNPVVLGSRSEPQPDIALLKPRADFYESAHPCAVDILLIIEVSDTSLRYDREIKVPLYAMHDIPEVWLLNVTDKQLIVFREPAENGYQDETHPGIADPLIPQRLPEIKLDLGGLFK